MTTSRACDSRGLGGGLGANLIDGGWRSAATRLVATLNSDGRNLLFRTYSERREAFYSCVGCSPASENWHPSTGRPQSYIPHDVNHLSRSLSWTVLCYCRALKCCSHSLSDPCPFALLPHFSFHFLSLFPFFFASVASSSSFIRRSHPKLGHQTQPSLEMVAERSTLIVDLTQPSGTDNAWSMIDSPTLGRMSSFSKTKAVRTKPVPAPLTLTVCKPFMHVVLRFLISLYLSLSMLPLSLSGRTALPRGTSRRFAGGG